MDDKIKASAYDILTAIHEIEIFLEGVPDFTIYREDLKTKRAIERNLEIVGEAMNRILKQQPNATFSDARNIVNPQPDYSRVRHSV